MDAPGGGHCDTFPSFRLWTAASGDADRPEMEEHRWADESQTQ